MKRQVFAALALALLLTAAPALAQQQDATLDYSATNLHPKQTDPRYVAMVFSKLSGRAPDFEGWIRADEDYKDAPPTEKPGLHNKMLADMQSAFGLLTLQEPIILEMPVKLSAYSPESRGFFIDSFKPDTFLPVTYAGQSYAVVPQGLMDKQWLGITDTQVIRAISDANAQAGDKGLTVLLMLAPKAVDASSPADIEGGKYWLVSAEISKVMLFGPDPNAPALWQSADSAVDAQRRQELLNLRQ